MTGSGDDGHAKAGAKAGGDLVIDPSYRVVKLLNLLLVNVGSIPTGPKHGEGRLQPHPGKGA